MQKLALLNLQKVHSLLNSNPVSTVETHTDSLKVIRMVSMPVKVVPNTYDNATNVKASRMGN